MQYSMSTILALAATASAQTLHVVSVSGEGDWKLKFSPDNIKAPVGDMVQFQFRGGNHSVVQSSFDEPCAPIGQSASANATGFYSGYQDVAASEAMGMIPTYTIMIQDEKPIWAYCSQAKHCQAGMVMVINENTEANATRSLDNYKAAAANVGESSAGGDAGASDGEVGTTPEPEEGAGAGGEGGDAAAPGGDAGGDAGSDAGAGAGAGGDSGSDAGAGAGAGAGGDAGSDDGAAAGGDSGSGSGSGDAAGGDAAGGDSAATPSSGSGAAEGAEAGASSPTTSDIVQAGAGSIGASSTLGLVALAAAFFML